MINEELDIIKAHLSSSTNLLFKKISNLLIEEIKDDTGKRKLDDQIKNLLYKLRAKIENYFKDKKLSKDELEILRTYWSELCLQKKQEIETSIPWLADQYEIKLINSSYSIPLIKDIDTTPEKLNHGQKLFEFKEKLHAFWKKELPRQLKLDRFNSHLTNDQKKFLLRQFLIALIFDCGCGNKIDLIAILQSLRESYSNDRISLSGLQANHHKNGGLISLYSKSILKTGFLYNYPLQNNVYANVVVENASFQIKQLYITPMSLLMMVRLMSIIEWETEADRHYNEKELIQVLELITNGGEGILDQYIDLALCEVDQNTVISHLFSKKKYKLFKHLDYVQYFYQENTLDGLTNALSKGSINSSALSVECLRTLTLLDVFKFGHNFKKEPKDLNRVLYYQESLPSKIKSRSIQNLSTSNHCAAKIKDGLIGQFKKQKKSEVIKKLSENLKSLKRSYDGQVFTLPKDIALISVQICVITWYLELIGGIQSSDHDSEIALSSLDTYKSSFVNDLFFYVVSHDLDLQVMDEEDYEVMYEYILNEKSTTDRRRNKQAFQNNVRQVKHDSYGDAVQNLKKFHKSLRRHFGVPRVDFLDRLPSGSLQMCRASYITPVMFEQFKNLIAVKNHLTTEQKNTLKVVSILAYRTGLRIREILGLRLRDLVMIDLEHNTIGYDQYYYLTSNSPNFVKILIRNNYYRQLKTPNAHRAMCLNELLTKDELRAFIDFIQKQMDHPISRKFLAGKDCFIFEDEFGQMISSRFVNQVTKEIFDSLFDGQPHDFSFHSFRHTAVNNLALVLKGSNELIISWTSYMQPQIEQIKKYLLGSSDDIAGRHDVWKILAHFIGHSSIEMTANHYLHFGSLLVGDALCSDERKISASIVRTLLSSRVFKKQLNTSQREEDIDLKKIVEKLAPSSKLIQEIVYPDRFTTSVVSQKEVKVLKEVDDRHQLMASCNHIIDVLSGELSDLTITTIGENLASKLYANRHFQHKKDTSKNNAIDVLLKHINRNRIGNLLINDNYRIINALLSSDFILDYFESHIRIIDARMEVYIKSKAEYQDFSKFLSEIRGIYGNEFKNKIKVSNISWKQIDTELKNAKSKKGVSLKIANLNYKDSTCQKIFSTIFLTYLYRWLINSNRNISNI